MGRKVQEANIRPSRTGKDMKREHARNNYNKAVFDKYGVEYPKEGWNWNDYEALAEELNSKIKAEGGNEFASAMNRLMVRFCC